MCNSLSLPLSLLVWVREMERLPRVFLFSSTLSLSPRARARAITAEIPNRSLSIIPMPGRPPRRNPRGCPGDSHA
ncbi:uncharacterized protein K452DRAFT_17656 [Aplosporella prunicola CBS 121167]|uniref:Uncharacterized protein n=1 Tax=Aplosporella prunicola CBS 121167 TaxID=1176127 RepID=A0A6A6BDY0_9PEZI|nr:uncharacterized protein K452DRAFT_17656 [Aplosporella prunicola CBS 121167]KAF2142370.1 hypothetical protein K452DRAFT_17656 [Aplosporella prunicola CBS 121167]